MIKLADTLAPMADFPAVMAEHTEFADGESLQEKLDNGALGGGGASYKQLSQAEYDALTDDEKMDGREYRTYDSGHIYRLGIEYGKDGVQISDNETVEDKTWSSQKTSSKIAEVETELNAKVDKKEYYNALDYGNPIIPQDADLNDYLTPGVYTCMSSTIANTLLNCPHIGSNFKLIVNKNRGNDDKLFYGYQMIVGTKGSNPVTDVCVYYRGISVYNNVCVFSKWKIMSGSTVADVPKTVIVSENPNIILNSNCVYEVINGICYVTLWGFQSNVKGQYVICNSMPRTRFTMQGNCSYGREGYTGASIFIPNDGTNNTRLFIEVNIIDEPLYGTFSYPVAE